MLDPDWKRGCSSDSKDGNNKNNPCPATSFSKIKHSIYKKEGIIRERTRKIRGKRVRETTGEGCEVMQQTRRGQVFLCFRQKALRSWDSQDSGRFM